MSAAYQAALQRLAAIVSMLRNAATSEDVRSEALAEFDDLLAMLKGQDRRVSKVASARRVQRLDAKLAATGRSAEERNRIIEEITGFSRAWIYELRDVQLTADDKSV